MIVSKSHLFSWGLSNILKYNCCKSEQDLSVKSACNTHTEEQKVLMRSGQMLQNVTAHAWMCYASKLTPGRFGPRNTSCRFGWGMRSTSWLLPPSSAPGGGTSRSVVWFTFVRPGRGSNAGISAENCRLRTYSSSQLRRFPFLTS